VPAENRRVAQKRAGLAGGNLAVAVVDRQLDRRTRQQLSSSVGCYELWVAGGTTEVGGVVVDRTGGVVR
jgi:hypothetical protein